MTQVNWGNIRAEIPSFPVQNKHNHGITLIYIRMQINSLIYTVGNKLESNISFCTIHFSLQPTGVINTGNLFIKALGRELQRNILISLLVPEVVILCYYLSI